MTAHSSKRAAPGRPFQPGQSGNPGGRPKGFARTVREAAGNDDGLTLARFLSAAALTGWMTYVHPETQAVTRERVSAPDRLAATRMLAERGWGKPPMYAPVEDHDPLDLASQESAEIAAGFDQRMDELAERRQQSA